MRLLSRLALGIVVLVVLSGSAVAWGQGSIETAFHMHSAGYFQVNVPTGEGWEISESDLPESEQVEAGQYYNVFAINNNSNAVVHFMVQPLVSAEDVESMAQNVLTDDYWETSWANYASWELSDQRVEDPYVITRFDLVNNGVSLVASDTSWLEAGWMYTVRGVYPAEASDQLAVVEDELVPSVVPYPELQALPPAWPIYVDQTLGYMIKYPPEWDVLDGNEGEPLSIAGPTNAKDSLIRVQVQDATPIAISTDAKSWLAEVAPTAEVTDSAPLERASGTGFELTYKIGTPLNPRSGLVVLLNDENETLYSANLEVGIGGLDLISGGDLLPDVAREGQLIVTQGFVFLRGISPVE